MLKDSMSAILSKNLEESAAVMQSLKGMNEQVLAAASILADSLRSGHKLMACGNGGSAADASHLTTEFVVRFMRDRKPYPAICLASNSGDVTAIGNDYAFEDIFARQVRAFAQPGDVLVALTTTGNSPNIHRALQEAKQVGIKSIAVLGRDGGKCRGLADVELIVASQVTARIQEAQKFLLHTLCEIVDRELGHL